MSGLKKPHVVVFFGGHSSNHDLSEETGSWVCHYIPRNKYQVTPVHVTSDGKWQVPLGSLPTTGPIKRMLDMLWQTIPAQVPTQALQRLLQRPVDSMLTVVRGAGGDDGSLHSLGEALSIPVVGSGAATSQHTAHKHTSALLTEEIASAPHTRYFRSVTPLEEIVEETRSEFVPPLFVKPATQEGSVGVEEVKSTDELTAAIKNAREYGGGDILLQERAPGTELAITLVEDAQGRILVLPPTIIIPKKTTFYDQLAKRRPGRVHLHTPLDRDNAVIGEAETIARDVYDRLGCRGIATIDLVSGEAGLDLLEVNTIPTLSEATPLMHQLRAAGLHPEVLLDQLIAQTLR
jgi:D-alanine-D-alanine ligase